MSKSNLVARLRNQKYNATIDEIYADSLEAADEIERLHNICEYARNEIKDQRAKIKRMEIEMQDMMDAGEW